MVAVRLWSCGLAGTCHTLILQRICQCVIPGTWLVRPVWRFHWLGGVSWWIHWRTSSCDNVCLTLLAEPSSQQQFRLTLSHETRWDATHAFSRACTQTCAHTNTHTEGWGWRVVVADLKGPVCLVCLPVKHITCIWLWLVKLYLIQQEYFEFWIFWINYFFHKLLASILQD